MKYLLITVLLLLVIAIPATFVQVQAQDPCPPDECKDPGASGFAPDEEPQAPGWDPSGAEEDAPGQKEGAHPQKEAPGQKGLESGIIGPMIR